MNNDKLVIDNMGLAVSIARQYRSCGMQMDDLVSEANIGLIRAAMKYDSSKGSFAAFAVPVIRRAVEQAIARQAPLYSVPRSELTPAERKRSRALSVDAPLGGRSNNVTLLSRLSDSSAGQPDDILDESVSSEEMRKAMSVLCEREREVISRFYGIGTDKMTFAEIGEALGIKRERARQIRKKALRKMRKV